MTHYLLRNVLGVLRNVLGIAQCPGCVAKYPYSVWQCRHFIARSVHGV